MPETTKVHGSGRHRPNRPKPITKVAKGTANLGQYTNKDDIIQLGKWPDQTIPKDLTKSKPTTVNTKGLGQGPPMAQPME